MNELSPRSLFVRFSTIFFLLLLAGGAFAALGKVNIVPVVSMLLLGGEGPTVTSTSPINGALGVTVNTTIQATFSEVMDDLTLTTSTFTLSTNPPVAGTVSYNSGTNTATFTPSSNMTKSTTYTATITQDVKDSDGNNMAYDYTWSFTTMVEDIAGFIDLPETGQTTCYDASGSVIACPNTGQDGDLLIGVSWPTPRFTDNGNGTMTDDLTGLIWLKNANCFNTRNWSDALSDANGLANGSCGLSDGSNAGDWRLPNLNELESLVNTEEISAAAWLAGQGFTNVKEPYYWSSTTYTLDTDLAWYFGPWGGGSEVPNNKAVVLYVWTVSGSTAQPAQLWRTGQTISYAVGDDGDLQKGVSLPSSRFTDNGNGTVTDTLTGLMWTQDAGSPGPTVCTTGTSKTWQDALSHVACLNTNNYLGYNDWRLPNRKELRSLSDFSQSSPALPPGHPFIIVVPTEVSFWSSTTYARLTDQAWYVSMWRGDVFSGHKSGSHHIWPVRAGQ